MVRTFKPIAGLRRPFVMLQKHSAFLRVVHARPRLFIAAAVAIACAGLLPLSVARHPITRALIAWNAGTCLHVVLAAVMMTRSTEQHMRRRALLQDDGQFAILVLVIVASVASLVAIAGQLNMVKQVQGTVRYLHVALAGLTVVSSWAFIQVMFALHYAHDYYAATGRGEPAPLQFPGNEQPIYGDFFYFAAVIGTSGQTADVSLASSAMRRIGAAHCILAYLFNTTVLALLINAGAGLL